MTDSVPEAVTVGWSEIRLAFAVVIGLAGGFWGLLILFSDYPPGWSETRWLVYVLVSHAAFGLVIGALVPRWWYLSLLAGWGALFLGLLGLLSLSTEFLMDLLLPTLASVLGGALLGAIAMRLIGRATSMKSARTTR